MALAEKSEEMIKNILEALFGIKLTPAKEANA